MDFPTRDETERVLRGLVRGTTSPAEANDWACRFVREGATHPAQIDAAVWNALTTLCGADLQIAPDTPLHAREDFLAWLEKFERDTRSG